MERTLILVKPDAMQRGLAFEVLRRLDDIARGAGVRIVDPARLGGDERRAFFEVRLPQFTLIARGLPTLRDAVAALARHLGTIPPPFARATPRAAIRRSTPRRSTRSATA